jgi:hypothetical protein
MKASSLSLAAVLTVATFSSASAGFVRGPVRPGFFGQTPFARHANPPAAFRPGPGATNDFQHFRRGFWPVFPAFFPYPAAPLSGAEASTGDDRGTTFSAPSYSTTIVMAAPQYGHVSAPALASVGGPKIITIGAPARSAHWRKMPIVVYGSASVGRSY